MIGFELKGTVATTRGARYEVRVPPDSPYFAGHFPGEPILPAAAQLALIESVAQGLMGIPCALHSIDRIRFRAPVLPGDELSLELTRVRDPEPPRATGVPSTVMEIVIRRAEELVTAGTLHLAALARFTPGPRGQDLRATADARAPRISANPAFPLPHAFPARFIERVHADDATSSRCTARIPSASPFTGSDGSCPALLAVELGAQAAAAAEAHGTTQAPGGSPGLAHRPGLLVVVQRAVFHAARLPLDVDYEVRVELARAAPPLRTWSISVRCAGALLASAEVSTFGRSISTSA